MTLPAALDAKHLRATAYFLGERIELRGIARGEILGSAPVVVRAGGSGLAALFRYGAAVLFGLEPHEEEAFLTGLRAQVFQPFESFASDEAEIVVESDERERLTPDGILLLREASIERLQIVAHVLAKSSVLAHYEQGVERILDRIEPLAGSLRAGGRGGVSDRQILRELGEVLLTQTRTVGRVEVAEHPEMTWDEPDLERLYTRLAEEYDLRERDLILERKLTLVSRTAETLLELLQNRRSLRVEWYIVALFAIDIALVVYDSFLRGG